MKIFYGFFVMMRTLTTPTHAAGTATSSPTPSASYINPIEISYAAQQANPFLINVNKTSPNVSLGIIYADGMNILCVTLENFVQQFISNALSTTLTEAEKTAILERLFGIYSVLTYDFMREGEFTTPELRDGKYTLHNYDFLKHIFGQVRPE